MSREEVVAIIQSEIELHRWMAKDTKHGLLALQWEAVTHALQDLLKKIESKEAP